MDRRTYLAVALAVAFLVGYQLILLKLYPPHPTPRPLPAQLAATPALSDVHSAADALPATRLSEPERRLTLAASALTIEVSSLGGTIAQVQLNEFMDPSTRHPVLLAHPADATTRLGFARVLTVNGAPVAEPSYAVRSENSALIAAAVAAPGLQLTKRYQINGRLIEGTISLTNTTPQPMALSYHLVTGAPLQSTINGTQSVKGGLPSQGLALADGKVKAVSVAKGRKQPIEFPGQHTVAGLASQYFALLSRWQETAPMVVFNTHEGNELYIETSWAPQQLAPGETATVHLQWYAGPREYRAIMAATPGMATLFPQGLLGTLGTGLLGLLRFYHRVTRNYGAAIILLTLTVSAALFPLTWMNLRMSRDAMAKMQVIQPKLERLKEQHKDNPEKLNRETIELYKKHDINPLAQVGGCLPLFLQFPVFIALYNTIRNSLELRGARFLWIGDLSAPDHAFIVAGFAINVLPLLMMGAMFFQMKLSPMRAASTAPGMPNMSTMMTVMFGIMFYSLPSALVLYWLTNTVVMTAVYFAMRPPAPSS